MVRQNRYCMAGLRRLRLGRDGGQALVELALVLPLLLLLLLAALDLGRLAYLAIEVSNASRAGALYGSQTYGTALNSAQIKVAAQADTEVTLKNVTQGLTCRCSNWGFDAPDRDPCTSASAPNCGSQAWLVTNLWVTASVDYSPWFPYLGIPGNTLSRKVSMRVGQ